MATNKISLVVKPVRSIPMVVKPVPKIGLMSMAPTKGDPGVGIESLEQTTKSTESGGTNVWTATLTDGTVHDFEVMNGDPGEGIATGGTPGQALVKASNTDYATRWMDILPEDTASGAVASFPDGADDLPMGVVVDIDPVQDLHGYDKPWPAGGGKNILDPNIAFKNGYVRGDDGTETASANTGYTNGIIPVEPGTNYTISGFTAVSGSGMRVYYLGQGGEWISRTSVLSIITRTITTPSDCYGMQLQLPSAGSDLSNAMIEKGSTATAYAPYSNICPISGRTGAKVTRTGRNLFDKSKATVGKFINDALQEIANTGKGHSELIPVKPSTTYFMNGFGGSGFYAMLAVDGDMKLIAWYGGASKSEPFTATTPSNCHYIYLNFNADQIDTMAFYEGNTNKGYIPFDGQTVTIQLGRTVYGGNVDVTSGKLVITDAMVDLGTLNYGYNATYKTFSAYKGDIKPHGMCISSQYKYSDGANAPDMTCCLGYTGWFVNNIVIKDGRYTDAPTFKSAMNGVQLCYELATPITLTLDPVEMRSLLGDNNVWADTGNAAVTYKADIQKYIDKKISAAVAAMS